MSKYIPLFRGNLSTYARPNPDACLANLCFEKKKYLGVGEDWYSRGGSVQFSLFQNLKQIYQIPISHSWPLRRKIMMTSSNGNIFRATGPLCGEFTGELPAQRPVRRSFDVFFALRLIKRLSKHLRGWWFETLSRPLWRHCNGLSWILSHENNRTITYFQLHYTRMIHMNINPPLQFHKYHLKLYLEFSSFIGNGMMQIVGIHPHATCTSHG